MCIATGYRGQETWQRGWSKAFGMGLLQEEATSPSHITSYVRKRKLQEIHKHRKLYAPQTQRPLSSSLAAIKLPLLLLLLLLLLSRFSRVWLCAPHRRQSTKAPLSLGFSRQEHWSGLPFPSPMYESEKWKWSCPVVSHPQWPHGPQPTRLLRPWKMSLNLTLEVGPSLTGKIVLNGEKRPGSTVLPLSH